MASIGTIDSKGFFGMPIVVPVTANAAPEGATFIRIRLKVAISGKEFMFSSPTTRGGSVNIDISSAFQAVYDSEEHTATVPESYSNYTATLTVYEDYMQDGLLHEGGGTGSATTSARPGSYSDRERISGTAPSGYSRKPSSSPEICFVNGVHLHPSEALINGPSVATPTVSTGYNSSYNIYGVPFPSDGYELRFINSLGVHENVFVRRVSNEVNISTERYVISRQETTTSFSRSIAIKRNDHERWRMSSPSLDEQWQQWYLHELLMARWMWINMGSNSFLAVHVIPEETTNGRDRVKANLLSVEFTIEFDINGSPSL